MVHQPVRLRIMAALTRLPRGRRLEFVRLPSIVHTTEGNLGTHIATLERAGYILVERDFDGRRPRIRISLTDCRGPVCIHPLVSYLRAILDDDRARNDRGSPDQCGLERSTRAAIMGSP